MSASSAAMHSGRLLRTRGSLLHHAEQLLRAGLALAVLAGLLVAVLPAARAGTPTAGSGMVSVIVRERAGAGQGPEGQVAALGGRVTRHLRIIGGFAATLPAPAVERLRRAEGVRAVTVDAALTPQGGKKGWDDTKDGDEHAASFDTAADLGSLQNAAKMIGADDLWAGHVTGRGVDVALVDTGVVPVAGLDGAGKVVNGPDLSFESQSPALRYLDANGHGTHMAGIIAGADDGDFTGIAPDARLVSVKVGAASGATDVSQVIAAIDWVVQHRNDDGLNIRVLNLSFGTDGVQDYLLDPLTYAVEVAWRKGIVVVVAAGNRGPEATRLDDPAYDPRVLAVGATDPNATAGTKDDLVASFSSRGNATRRVDLVAPGRSIVGLRNPGSNVDLEHPLSVVADRFTRGSGTSQAAAVTSGAVALLLQKRPTLTPDQVKALLRSTAKNLDRADPLGRGEGLLDLHKAAGRPPPRRPPRPSNTRPRPAWAPWRRPAARPTCSTATWPSRASRTSSATPGTAACGRPAAGPGPAGPAAPGTASSGRATPGPATASTAACGRGGCGRATPGRAGCGRVACGPRTSTASWHR